MVVSYAKRITIRRLVLDRHELDVLIEMMVDPFGSWFAA